MLSYKRYAVVPEPYSFGFTVRQAIKRPDGTITLPLPHRLGDVVTMFKRQCAAESYAASLTKSALDKLFDASYPMVEGREER